MKPAEGPQAGSPAPSCFRMPARVFSVRLSVDGTQTLCILPPGVLTISCFSINILKLYCRVYLTSLEMF